MPADPAHPARRKPRRGVTATAWLLGAGALASSTLWMFSGMWWQVDLAANLGAQMLAGCALAGLIVGAVRRWGALAVIAGACGLHLVPMLEHRAALWPRTIDAARSRGPGVVRFLHYNDSTKGGGREQEVYDLIERSGADVVAIQCPPVRMQFDVVYSRGLEDKYPGKLVREWKPSASGGTDVTAAFVVSRWPMTKVDCAFVGPMADQFIAAVVERPAPEGRFAVVAVHPRSPRWKERWESGKLTSDAAVALTVKLREQGLPVVVLADLNSTPTGYLSRHLCAEAALRRAKPLLVADGTYPDVLPYGLRPWQRTSIPAHWPLSIAIDDALIGEGIEVTGWRVEKRLTSGHRPVTIDLFIPPPEKPQGAGQ